MLVATEVAGSWDPLGSGGESLFFQKRELFDLPWGGVDLSAQLWAVAPNGGPVAMIRDSRKFAEVTGGPITPTLQIYNGAGALLGSMPWHAMDSVVALCWSPEEHLLVVDRGGRVSVRGWDCREVKEKSFTLPLEGDAEITHVRRAGPSMAVTTRSGAVFVVPDVREPTPELLATLPEGTAIIDMTVVPTALSSSGALELLLATSTQLLRLDASGRAIVPLPSTPSLISLAPNGLLVAVLFDSPPGGPTAGTVRVYTLADVATPCVAEIRVPRAEDEEDDQVADLAWCGSDALALLSSNCRLSIASPFGEFLHYDINDQALLVTEVDGLRVLTRRRHLLILRVPQCSVDTFQIGSVEPPARLLEARIKFDDQDPDSDRILRSMGASTAAAVTGLADAALHEWTVGLQRSLLQAASLGAAQKSTVATRGKVGEASLLLRVLNTVRRPPFSMGLTIGQLQDLTPRRLVLRLCTQGQHPAAYQMAKELRLGAAEVLEHWAAHRVASTLPSEGDATLLGVLQDRLAMEPGVSYSAVATHAAKAGRRALAAQLLEMEPSAARAVPLLLDLGVSFARALDKAIQSGDPDLVYLCIFHALKDDSEGLSGGAVGAGRVDRQRARLDALRVISTRPLARSLFLSYCAHAGLTELAKELSSAADKVQGDLEAAEVAVGRAPRDKETQLLVEKAVRSFRSVGPDGAPFDKYLVDWPRLLVRQAALEKETSLRGLLGSHMTATLRQLLIAGFPRQAQDLAREFGVSERRFLQVQVQAMIACRNWDRLLELVGKELAQGSGVLPSPASPEMVLPSLKGTEAPPHLIRHVIRRLPGDAARRAAAYREHGMESEALLEESGRGTAAMESPAPQPAKGWLASWRGGAAAAK